MARKTENNIQDKHAHTIWDAIVKKNNEFSTGITPMLLKDLHDYIVSLEEKNGRTFV